MAHFAGQNGEFSWSDLICHFLVGGSRTFFYFKVPQLMTFSSEIKKVITVFFPKSTQPRSSAHLQKAPILKAEKVNEHPASNKCPPHPTPPRPPSSSQWDTSPKTESSSGTEYLQKPYFVTSSHFVITIYCFVAWPQIRPAIKVEKFSKFPGWLIKYMNLLISHFSFINYYVSTLFILSWHFSQYITQK